MGLKAILSLRCLDSAEEPHRRNPVAGFLYLLDMLELAVGEINQSMKIDKHAFDTVIAVCRTSKWPIQFEQVWKVSRTHPSRKVFLYTVQRGEHLTSTTTEMEYHGQTTSNGLN